VARLPSGCRICGIVLDEPGRINCDNCLPDFRAQQQADFAAAGLKALADLRRADTDPAHGGTARERRAQTMRQRHREAAAWGDGDLTDPGHFERMILPTIQDIPLRRLAEATGLSLGYCALIRAGERVPRPQHWPAFARASAQTERLNKRP
jgi:hypothetical protein